MSVAKNQDQEVLQITNGGIADLSTAFARTSSTAGKIRPDCRILTIFEGTDKIFSPLPQLLREAAGIYEGIPCNQDKEMNILAEFILDKGSYPRDVVS
jgi:hypothetical protein